MGKIVKKLYNQTCQVSKLKENEGQEDNTEA